MDSDFILNHPEDIYTVLLETSIMCLVIFGLLLYLEKSGEKNKPPLKKNAGHPRKRRRIKRR